MLENLLSFHTVSGMEQKFSQWFKEKLEPHADRIDLDRVGNLLHGVERHLQLVCLFTWIQ